jgi:hypothetical protein
MMSSVRRVRGAEREYFVLDESIEPPVDVRGEVRV